MTIETLRKGIIDRDWDVVISGFNSLSAVFAISPIPTAKKRGRPKKSKEEESPILDIESDVEEGEDLDEAPVKSKRKRNAFVNTWKDTGRLCVEDKAVDKKLIVAKPVERNRKSPMKKIRCQACDKTVEVHGSLIYDKDSYTCSKCIPVKGR